ncbi:MAG: GNAT family N-acetyltransferase [Bacteroidales bacterium]|nr:GNAT family N-acetyltransferase [Bacteroidales bacterium]
MNKITIREAVREEAPVIADFQVLMAMETEGCSLRHDIIMKGVKAVFEDPAKGRYFIAEEAGKPLASMLITPEWSDWRNSFVWWFQSVYVIPEARRRGIFRMMYNHVREMAEKEGAAGLRLYVEAENSRAQKTYEAMGMDSTHYKMYEWMRE